MDRDSKGFIHRFMEANPNCHAGTSIIGKKRQQVTQIKGNFLKDKRTLSELPKMFDPRNSKADARGTGAGIQGLGPFRQVTTLITGGYDLSYDDRVASKRIIPWATRPSLTTQEGTGGFCKIRDVVDPMAQMIQALKH